MTYIIDAETREVKEVEDIVFPLTEDQVRELRDSMLASSDWTQVADAPVDQAAWATYRQALRDIPQQEGFPENIVWPESP